MMTGRFASARIGIIEQAIKILINDPRIPEAIRTALETFQGQWSEPNKPEIATMRSGQTEVTCLPEIVRSSDAESYPCNSPTFAHEDGFLLSCGGAVIQQGLMIRMEYDKQSLDWSVQINGQRYPGVTSEDMEALVECAVIVTETSMMRALSARPQ